MATATVKAIYNILNSSNPHLECIEVIVKNPIGVRIQQARECRKLMNDLVLKLELCYTKEKISVLVNKTIEELNMLRGIL